MTAAGLAEVLARFGPAYLAPHRLAAAQAKAWRAIGACRTAALGGHLESCDGCGRSRHVYHSCRNRHCPRCQTRAKEAWLAARRREVLPVPYFHLVFTLPHALNGLIAAAPRRLYETLFAVVATTLGEFAANRRHLGGVPSFSLVLHTWKQDLGRHVHVHALVAGGALAPGGEWIAPKKGFLFPVRALSGVFRGKFVTALDALRAAGRLPASVAANADWQRLRHRLYAHDWVVYAKEPLGGPAAVLDYLARYTHRVAISNERILGIDGHEVLLRVRADGASGNKRTLRIAGTAFIDRFLQHVLPCGFKRIRHYGLLAPARKHTQLAAARAALGAPSPQPALIESVAAFLHRVLTLEYALPALRQRPVARRRGDPTQSSPARSAGAAVTIDAAPSLARRSDGVAVRALARPGHRQRCLRIRRSPSQRRPNGAVRPLERIGQRRQSRSLHAIRLTSGSTTLQSP